MHVLLPVLQACAQNGMALQFASDALLANEEVTHGNEQQRQKLPCLLLVNGGRVCMCIYIYAVGSITWPYFGQSRVNNLAMVGSITWPSFLSL